MNIPSRILICIIFSLSLTSCLTKKLVNPEVSDSYFVSVFGKITYLPKGNWFELRAQECNADVNSFQVLSQTVAKDKTHVYVEGLIQNDIDVHQFVFKKNVFRDNNYVYSLGRGILIPVPVENPETFEYLANSKKWAKDSDHYYHIYKKQNVDFDSFKIINDFFTYDKDSIYVYLNKRLSGFDRQTDTIARINRFYIHDSQTVYYLNTYSDTINQIKFDHILKTEQISGLHIRINDQIIYKEKVIKKGILDVASFETIGGLHNEKYSKDKNNVYFEDNIIPNADPLSFKVLGFKVGKDDNHVFFKTKIVENIDSQSFHAVSENRLILYFEDGNGNRYNENGQEFVKK
ncbi:MAG: DKNYY domain-containing protein [Flavobacteriaceae bacterium]